MLAAPAVLFPDSLAATLCYLTGLLLIAGHLIVAARSPVPGRRRSRLAWIVAVACAISGSAAWQSSALPGAPDLLGDVAQVLWIVFYVPATVAVHRMLVDRALPRTVRQAIAKDVAVVTAAGLAFAWYLLIHPALESAEAIGGWSIVLIFGYPLGDVVLLTLAVTLLLIPGRRTAAELLVVIGLGTSLLVDIGNALLPAQAGSDRWYLPSYLLINAALTAALLHPAPDPASRVEEGQDMRGWRMALLGIALCGVGLSMMLLPDQGWGRIPAAVAMVVMIAVILARLRRAVADLEDAERTLRHQATHDQLTGLANRSRLLADMRHAVRESPTLFFVDLDGFKAVNDTHGHHCGDLVLQAVAERLTRVVRQTDTVARLGGDEFVVVCTGLAAADTTALSARIESVLAEPIDVGDCTVVIGASIGLLSLPAVGELTDQQAEELISDLLSSADAAMYEAKRSGGGTRIVEHAHVSG